MSACSTNQKESSTKKIERIVSGEFKRYSYISGCLYGCILILILPITLAFGWDSNLTTSIPVSISIILVIFAIVTIWHLMKTIIIQMLLYDNKEVGLKVIIYPNKVLTYVIHEYTAHMTSSKSEDFSGLTIYLRLLSGLTRVKLSGSIRNNQKISLPYIRETFPESHYIAIDGAKVLNEMVDLLIQSSSKNVTPIVKTSVDFL